MISCIWVIHLCFSCFAQKYKCLSTLHLRPQYFTAWLSLSALTNPLLAAVFKNYSIVGNQSVGLNISTIIGWTAMKHTSMVSMVKSSI